MKKLQILLPMAAVLLSLTGCKKDNEKSGPSGETVTLSATLGGGEKTEIYNETKMRWSAGDAVTINEKEYFAEFNVDYETAFFNVDASTDGYYAYYPASLYDEENNKYVLPSTQYYNVENYNILSDISPMYAEIMPDTETTELQFHHICALVKLEVTGTGTVKQIVVTSSLSNLCGDFGIFDEDGRFYAEIWNGERSVTLDCGKDGVALNATTPKTFYIALPEGSLFDLTFKCCGDDGVWTSQPIATANLTAGKLYTKKLENVEMKPVPVIEFSVSATQKVKFAPGNLYYNGADASNKMNTALPSGWNFYEHQWDCYSSGTESVDESMEINLFTWGFGTWSTAYDMFECEIGDEMTDWGTAPGLPSAGEGKKWRTLTNDEWNYLLGYDPDPDGGAQTATYGRPNAMNLCARVKLTDVNVYGLVILPDGSDATASGVTTSALVSSSGAVFLPAAGYRYGTAVNNFGSNGYYWSSTPGESYPYMYMYFAYSMWFDSDGVDSYDVDRGYGYAVRLVR